MMRTHAKYSPIAHEVAALYEGGATRGEREMVSSR
jgi:hypothetical protein